MPTVQFGNAESHATILYDRETHLCILLANSDEFVSEALAVVNTLKVDEVIIVLPLHVTASTLVPSEVYCVYRLKK